MKGNVRFNLQLVFFFLLKYAVLVAVLVFKDLVVEKPERKGQKPAYQRESLGEKVVCLGVENIDRV